MNTELRTRRILISGTAVELWENPDVPFSCGTADVQGYMDRGDWVSLFNAVALASPRMEPACGS